MSPTWRPSWIQLQFSIWERRHVTRQTGGGFDQEDGGALQISFGSTISVLLRRTVFSVLSLRAGFIGGLIFPCAVIPFLLSQDM